MSKYLRGAVIALACMCANAHMAQWATPNNLQAVQGLYVKPSIDGTTGDLYVAASEDNGVNSQWVMEEPVNFLQPPGYPLTYTSSMSAVKSPHDGVVTTQKRAVISSPPMQYTYAVPGATDGNNAIMPYPYATVPAANTATIAEGTPASQYPQSYPGTASQYPQSYPGTASQYPQSYPGSYPYSLMQYFYPYLMSVAAASALKDMGVSDEVINAFNSQSAPSMWSPASSYTYPWPYMMDPNAWAQSSAAAAAAATTSASPVPTTSASSETTADP